MVNKIAAGILFSIFLAGCAGSEEQVVFDRYDLPQVIASGRLRVLMENSSSGYMEHDGKLIGFEYELMNDFASSLGVKLSLVKVNDLDSIMHFLSHGKADIAALGLTITNERQQLLDFSEPYMYTRQVLVQHKPSGWEKMPKQAVSASLVKDIFALKGKTITVRRNSSFYSRLQSLVDETGTRVKILSAPGNYTTEKLIEMVAKGDIEMTIADEHIAQLNSLYFRDLDIQTAVSLKQKIGWGLNKGTPKLRKKLNEWLAQEDTQKKIKTLYRKYYEGAMVKDLRKHGLGSLPGSLAQMIRLYSRQYGWDHRLILSLINSESGGNHFVKSWAGATGIMQLMPETAAKFGTSSTGTPAEHIRAGILYLSELDNFWKKYVKNPQERTFFIIASYNTGPGHVLDARNLAMKYGANPELWEGNVKEWMIKKEDPSVFCDEVVKHGFSYGSVTARYVDDVIGTYHSMISKEERMNVRLTRVTQ